MGFVLYDPKHHLRERYMREAIQEALCCGATKKFGAVVVRFDNCEDVSGGDIIAREHSSVHETLDPTQHSKLKAIASACRVLGNDRGELMRSILYTTCEPCVMCSGAILWAKPWRVVWGMLRTDAHHCFDDSRG